MIVELLYFENCPNHIPARNLLRQTLAEQGMVEVTIREMKVTSKSMAESMRFLGSPTIRVNGIDIEDEVGKRTGFDVQCRMYSCEGVLLGVPHLTDREARAVDCAVS